MQTRGYTKSDGAHIAYSVSGDGPLALLYMQSNMLSFDAFDEEPQAAQYYRRLAGFSRLVRFDVRGVGLSDPIDPRHPPTVEDFARDGLAVLDALEIDRAAVVGEHSAGSGALALAANAPDRVQALVLVSSLARSLQDVDYPEGFPPELAESFTSELSDPDSHWELEGADDLALMVPSRTGDERLREWWVRESRRGASPASARAWLEAYVAGDVREVIAHVAAPALVLHSRGNGFIPIAMARYLASHLPDARLVELDGRDSVPWAALAETVTDEIEEFLTGRRSPRVERVLTTVLFTDIVDSTGRAAAMGDRAWHALLDTHDAVVRAEIRRFGGREVNSTGDGFLSSYDSPTQGVLAAQAMIAAATTQGIAIRAGLHTGECERRGDDLAGLTVHIAARVAGLAASGEVLVSRTVRDLVSGSGLSFVARGEHELKGVPEVWQLFALQA